jgi:hypothetical protein
MHFCERERELSLTDASTTTARLLAATHDTGLLYSGLQNSQAGQAKNKTHHRRDATLRTHTIAPSTTLHTTTGSCACGTEPLTTRIAQTAAAAAAANVRQCSEYEETPRSRQRLLACVLLCACVRILCVWWALSSCQFVCVSLNDATTACRPCYCYYYGGHFVFC